MNLVSECYIFFSKMYKMIKGTIFTDSWIHIISKVKN